MKSTALKGRDQLWGPACVSLAVSTSPRALCVDHLKQSQHSCVPAGVVFQRLLKTDMDLLPHHATSSPSPMSPSVSTKQLLWMIPLCVIRYLSCMTLSNVGLSIHEGQLEKLISGNQRKQVFLQNLIWLLKSETVFASHFSSVIWQVCERKKISNTIPYCRLWDPHALMHELLNNKERKWNYYFYLNCITIIY